MYNNNNELPSTIRKLPYDAQSLYRGAFNKVNPKYDSMTSGRVAWELVKKRFTRVGTEWVAKGMSRKMFVFDMKVSDNVFIKKADDGEYYLEATLSDTDFDGEGNKFTAEALEDYATQINTFGVSGNITHKSWDEFTLENSHLSEEDFVKKARSERKGIFKTIKAVFKEGKLWIKALIDKRYMNHVRKFNRVSIEALVPSRYQDNKVYQKGGYVLGFALDNNPINPRAIAQITNE